MTVLELLAAIVVIGLVAALGIGLAGYAERVAKVQRVKSELSQLAAAIELYKAHFGFYPPDNHKNPVTNQLYYELTGAVFTGSGFRSVRRDDEISPAVLENLFNVRTLANSSRDAKEVKTFLQLKPIQHRIVYTNPTVEVLAVPVSWPTNRAQFPPPLPAVVGSINPWRYVSTKPTNNPRSFDLWAEIVVGNQRKIIGNW